MGDPTSVRQKPNMLYAKEGFPKEPLFCKAHLPSFAASDYSASPHAARSSATRSVRSQVKSASSRPK